MILLLESKMVRVWSGKGNSPKYERDVGQPYHLVIKVVLVRLVALLSIPGLVYFF